MRRKIFISYRRSDTAGHAQNLCHRLANWFDTDNELFFDTVSIDSGEEFPQRLIDEIDCAAVVLVLIGPGWLDEIDRRARLDEVDFVRREVEQALQRRAQGQGLRVIPVLLGGAVMPSAAALAEPVLEGMTGLCALDAHVFQSSGKQDDWEHQFVRLRSLIRDVHEAPRECYRDRSCRPKPWKVVGHALSAHFQDPGGWLSMLRERLHGGGGTAAAVVGAGRAKAATLHGMGGIGKTQLALAYCHQYRDAYAGIWWLRAESEGGLGDALLQQDALAACAAVGVAVPEGVLPSEVFRQWLVRQTVPWLLVFDNADDPRMLSQHLPGPGPHHVILTSRRPDWGALAGSAVVELVAWTPGQGADFLLQRLGEPEAERAAAEALSAALGGLPLALEQAASYTETTGCGLSDYLTQWRQAEAELLDDAESVPVTGYERTVAATLALAFDRLGEPARRLLRLCALAAQEPLPERFLREGRAHLPEPLATAAGSDFAWNKVVAELRRYALVARQDIPSLDRAWLAGGEAPAGTPMEPALVMHRLMQVVVRVRLVVAREDGAGLVRVLWAVCPEDSDHPSNWPQMAAIATHAVYINAHDWAGKIGHLEDFQASTALLNNAAVYLQLGLGHLAQARDRFEQVLAIRRRVFGEMHLDTLASTNNLAVALAAHGDLASARQLEENMVVVRSRTLGDSDPDTLRSMMNLAETRRSQGDLAGARMLQERVLTVRIRVLGEEAPDTLTAMNNLAGTLLAQRDFAEARRLNEHVLAINCRLKGEDDIDTLRSMNNLTIVLMEQSELIDARRLGVRALAGRRRLLGETHFDTLSSMNNLAVVLWLLGERNEAIELMAIAANTASSTLGPNHRHTRISADWLAQMRRATG